MTSSTTTAAHQAVEVKQRILTRLRDTLAGRDDVRSSVAFAEAMHVAELLLSSLGDPAAVSNDDAAEILRNAAIALAAVNRSYTAVHPSASNLLDADRALGHAEAMAECLVLMADTLTSDGIDDAAADITDTDVTGAADVTAESPENPADGRTAEVIYLGQRRHA